MKRGIILRVVITLLLGFLGVHKFLEGNTFLGIIYLLWLPIGFVGYLVDFLSTCGGLLLLVSLAWLISTLAACLLDVAKLILNNEESDSF